MEFNFKRTVSVLVRKIYANRKSFLIFAGIFFLIMTVFHYMGARTAGIVVGGENLRLNAILDMLCIIIVAGIYPFIEITEKKNAAFELLYPASRTEKFVVEVLTAFIIVPICVIAIDISALYVGSLAGKVHFANRGVTYILPYFPNIFSQFAKWEYADWMFITGGVIISFLGCLLFKKYRVIKSWVCVGLIGLFIFAAGAIIMWFNYKATGYWFPYSMTTNGHFNEVTGQMVFETEAYYKGVKLDYIPWFFNGKVWTVVTTVFFLVMFCLSWFRYKKERA